MIIKNIYENRIFTYSVQITVKNCSVEFYYSELKHYDFFCQFNNTELQNKELKVLNGIESYFTKNLIV